MVIGEYIKEKVASETFTVIYEEKIFGSDKTVIFELDQDLNPVYSFIRQIVIQPNRNGFIHDKN